MVRGSGCLLFESAGRPGIPFRNHCSDDGRCRDAASLQERGKGCFPCHESTGLFVSNGPLAPFRVHGRHLAARQLLLWMSLRALARWVLPVAEGWGAWGALHGGIRNDEELGPAKLLVFTSSTKLGLFCQRVYFASSFRPMKIM